MTMLLGNNMDDTGSNSNGSGKSTLIEAITLAITGDVYRGVSKEDYIKYNEKLTLVDFELRNDILNETLNIRRTIYNSSKSAKVELYINGEYPKHIPTATNGGLDVSL
jgi:DNA repair exonuclease SbcCD ATPase subunit